MANVLLGVTGSVAAGKTREIFDGIESSGHRVRIVATEAATYFFDPNSIHPIDGRRNPAVVTLDDDEWPGRLEGAKYRRGDAVLHIELRRWADLFLIAPLDANTLAKFAHGICDNCLTCIWRAWDPSKPIILAPAMNTLMWQHPTTRRQLRWLAEDFAAADIPPRTLDSDECVARINSSAPRLRIIPPVEK
ncbi:MAG: phosphopantothenoylcysteine decarboxylase, partial [Gemmataceae bacterium]|nr:phosphopantothenoylcysteine decarboxylase [Gemmataceae bacterium]